MATALEVWPEGNAYASTDETDNTMGPLLEGGLGLLNISLSGATKIMSNNRIMSRSIPYTHMNWLSVIKLLNIRIPVSINQGTPWPDISRVRHRFCRNL